MSVNLKLYDMHCHLDFAPNAAEAAAQLDALGIGAFAVSVLPMRVEQGTGFCSTQVKWGVGLHPWWLADGRAGKTELDALLAAIPHNIYIGEVGLDFGKTHGQQKNVQREAFEGIACACAKVGGRVLSIHAVHAADVALDILETTGVLKTCTCIFHWFSDSGEALKRAIDANCYFSVGALMLRSARGREYARQIPPQRLLLETDEPPQGQTYNVSAMQKQLAKTLEQIAELKRVGSEELGAIVASTSLSLLSCDAL